MPPDQISAPSVLVTAGLVLLLAILGARPDRRHDVLPFAIGMSSCLVGFQLGGVNIFTYLVLFWTLGRINSRRTGRLPGAGVILGLASAAMALTAFFGDLVQTRTLAFQLIALAACALVLAAWANAREIQMALRGMLAMCSIASAVAVLQTVGLITPAVWETQTQFVGRPTGLYAEPDWMGFFAALGLFLAIRLVPRWQLFLVALNGAVMVLAFARAAWVALVAVAALALLQRIWFGRQRNGLTTQRVMAVAAIALVSGVAVFVMNPTYFAALAERFQRSFFAHSTDVSAQARVRQFNSLNELAASAPWHGHGLSAAGRVLVYGGIDFGGTTNNVATNWVLGAWVDGALIAVPFVLILVWIALRGSRTIPGLALVLALVNSLFSNVTYTPVTWMLLGLTLASLRLRSSAQGTPAMRGLNVTPTTGASMRVTQPRMAGHVRPMRRTLM